MDTKERVELKAPPRNKRSGPWIAAAAFAAVIVIGLATVLLTSRSDDNGPATPTPTEAPSTTVALADIDVAAADPIQATTDQSRRVTVKFAGDARTLAEGAVHLFEIQVHMDGTEGLGGREFTVTYTNRDGVITTTGTSPNGDEVAATWEWFADDGLLVMLTKQSLPDTRPEVNVSVQETASAEVIEFVMDSPAGPIG